jgi:hypothetical protein
MVNSYFGLGRPGAADAANRCRSALPSCYHLFPPVSPGPESKNFNYLVLILSCVTRGGASSREAPATGGVGARGDGSTT